MKKGLTISALFVIFMLFLSPFAFAEEIFQEASQEVSQEPVSEETSSEENGGGYSGTEKFVDNVKMIFFSGDNKAGLALEISEKQVDSAIDALKSGDSEKVIKELEGAQNKLEIVQEIASSDIAEEIVDSVAEVTMKIEEIKDINPEISDEFEQHLTEEEKTGLSAELSEKLYDYCEKLALQSPNLIEQDEKCNSENAPEWLQDKIDDKIGGSQKQAAEEMINQLSTCMNDPRECDCSKIPVAEMRSDCEKGSALAIRCEFQNDESACMQLKEMGPPKIPSNMPEFLKPLFQKTMDETIKKKEGQMFDKFAPPECKAAGATSREACEKIMMEKNAPRECIEAGATTREACEKIMIGIHGPPPTECMENGEFIGPEACGQKMVNSGMIPQECVRDGKPIPEAECRAIMEAKGAKMGTIPPECMKEGRPIPEEECLAIMKEKGIMMGPPKECAGKSPEECQKIMEGLGIKPGVEQGGMMSGECAELGIFEKEKCDEIVNLPRPCKDMKLFTAEACETHMMVTHMPQECVDAGALTPESCKRMLMPKECRDAGLYSRADCDVLIMTKNMPADCQQEGGALSPEECAAKLAEKVEIAFTPGSELEYLNKQGISSSRAPSICMSGSNFVRSMDCDAALAQIGIVLPAPTDISNIPSECLKDGVPVSPQECQRVLETKLIVDVIPLECREAGVENPEDCGNFIEKQRKEIGMNINLPEECYGKSVEECAQLTGQQPQKPACAEGDEGCMPGQEGEIIIQNKDMSSECVELGIGDSSSCNIVMSKINEERMKNGDKMIVDENGNHEFITNDEINQIVKNAEKRAEEYKPDTEELGEYKQDIVLVENKIQQVEQVQQQMIQERQGRVEQQQMMQQPESPSGGEAIQSGGGQAEMQAGGESSGGGGEATSSGGGGGESSGGGGESSGGESGGGGEVTSGAITGEAISAEFEKQGVITSLIEKIKSAF